MFHREITGYILHPNTGGLLRLFNKNALTAHFSVNLHNMIEEGHETVGERKLQIMHCQ